MSEKEMLEEINRLRGELAEVREERDCLRKMVCKMLPFEEIQLTEEDLQSMRETAVTFEELLGLSSKPMPQQNGIFTPEKDNISSNF